MNKALQQHHHALARALKRLADPQGMVARRNARAATLGALNAIRKEVDSAYPAIRRKAKPRSSKRPHDRANRWRREGWKPLGIPLLSAHSEAITKATQAGIKLRRLAGTTWAPAWFANHWQQPVATLERMRSNAHYRKAFEVEHALSQEAQ